MSELFDGTDVREIRLCRGFLLDALNSVYGKTFAPYLDEREIIDVCLELTNPISEDYVRRDLAYLRDRGLVECETAQADSKTPSERQLPRVRRWRLTAKGVTFCERGKPWMEIEAL